MQLVDSNIHDGGSAGKFCRQQFLASGLCDLGGQEVAYAIIDRLSPEILAGGAHFTVADCHYQPRLVQVGCNLHGTQRVLCGGAERTGL